MKKIIVSITLLLLSVYSFGLTFTPDKVYTTASGIDAVPRTYEAWIKLPKGYAPRGGIIAGSYGISSCYNFEIGSAGIPRLYLGPFKNLTADIQFTDVHANNGFYTHVAVVLDKAEARCYINGRLAQTLTEASINTQKHPISKIATGICSQKMRLGGDNRVFNNVYFKGSILSAAEFSDIRDEKTIRSDMYNINTADKNLIFYYDLRNFKGQSNIEDKGGKYPLSYEDNKFYYPDNEMWLDTTDNSGIAYSIALLGDTQVVNDEYPEKLPLLYDWILDNKDKYNISYVIGLGDITNRDLPREWDLAKEQYQRLNGKIPWAVVKGNHDSPKMFNGTFAYDEYKSTCDGFYSDKEVENTYRIIEINSNKYIIFTFEYGPSDEVMAWAGKILDEHPDCKGIITTHCYLFRDGTTLDDDDVCPPTLGGRPNNGDDMWEKFVRKHKNIQFVINGHDPCERVIAAQDKGDAGNTVTQLLVDPQGTDAGQKGACLICILGFSADGRQAYIRYYSAAKKKYYMSINQYELSLE